jgi:hypothetical protein
LTDRSNILGSRLWRGWCAEKVVKNVDFFRRLWLSYGGRGLLLDLNRLLLLLEDRLPSAATVFVLFRWLYGP